MTLQWMTTELQLRYMPPQQESSTRVAQKLPTYLHMDGHFTGEQESADAQFSVQPIFPVKQHESITTNSGAAESAAWVSQVCIAASPTLWPPGLHASQACHSVKVAYATHQRL